MFGGSKEAICLVVGRACPKSADPKKGDYCPWWWTTHWTDDRGETKTKYRCGVTELPGIMVHVVKASNRGAAAVEGHRNAVVDGVSRLLAQSNG